MMALTPIITAVVCMVLHHICWWLLSLWYRRYDYADIAWGTGGMLGALIIAFHTPHSSVRLAGAALLVALWGMRLATHLALRTGKRSDDTRYLDWFNDYRPLNTLIRVYLAQALLLCGMLTPLMVIAVSAESILTLYDIGGALLWVIGFLYETVADAQLAAYLEHKEQTDSIMRTGLWRLSRHPNYWGELLQWWGVSIIALSVPYGWIGLISPLLITYLITCVSGLPLVEQGLAENRVYRQYQITTSALIPFPPEYIPALSAYIPFIICIGTTLLVGTLGSICVYAGIQSGWYSTVALPAITPPQWVFRMVWPVLYVTTAWSALRAWKSNVSANFWRITLYLYGLNGLLNILWTYLFFVQHQLYGAYVITILLELTIIMLIQRLWHSAQHAALLLLPYALWIAYALALQTGILQLV